MFDWGSCHQRIWRLGYGLRVHLIILEWGHVWVQVAFFLPGMSFGNVGKVSLAGVSLVDGRLEGVVTANIVELLELQILFVLLHDFLDKFFVICLPLKCSFGHLAVNFGKLLPDQADFFLLQLK